MATTPGHGPSFPKGNPPVWCSLDGRELGHWRRRFGQQIGDESRTAARHVVGHHEGQGCGSGGRRNAGMGAIPGRRCTAISNVLRTQLTVTTGQADPNNILGTASINDATRRLLGLVPGLLGPKRGGWQHHKWSSTSRHAWGSRRIRWSCENRWADQRAHNHRRE